MLFERRPVRLGLGGAGLLQKRSDSLLQLLRNGDGGEVSLPDADEDVLAARDGIGGVRLALDLEVQVDRGSPDPAEIRLDHQQLVELDGLVEVALDAHARQPDAQDFKEEAVVQSRRAQQLRFGEPKEPQIRLVVNDARGVNIFPADILLDAVTSQRSLPGSRSPLDGKEKTAVQKIRRLAGPFMVGDRHRLPLARPEGFCLPALP